VVSNITEISVLFKVMTPTFRIEEVMLNLTLVGVAYSYHFIRIFYRKVQIYPTDMCNTLVDRCYIIYMLIGVNCKTRVDRCGVCVRIFGSEQISARYHANGCWLGYTL